MLTAREITTSDIPFIADYWLGASDKYLVSMGADPSKMPSREDWYSSLQRQIKTPYSEESSFGTIWLENEKAFGHCNINLIEFRNQAHMHLHVWNVENRRKGFGKQLVVESLKLFFEKFKLEKIVCEPYSENIAPHKTLEKIGFKFIKEYITIPGSINFEQSVKRWEITRERFKELAEWNHE